jgi:toxin ParE1/3/4
MSPAIFRPQAVVDVEDAALDYEEERVGLGIRFARAVEVLTRSIEENPNIGSLRYAHLLPNLRWCKVNGFPYLLFYLERGAHIDVLRVLHGHRDLPQYLEDISPG